MRWRALLAMMALSACAHARDGARSAAAPTQERVQIRLVAINDFHGQLEPTAAGAPGAAALAASLREARAGFEGRSLVLHVGDLVGASPASSGLLQDEPTVTFFGLLGNARCAPAGSNAPAPRPARDPSCDLVGTIGNHELDEGLPELRRLLLGGAHPRGPFLDDPWPGARFPTICANVVDAATGTPVFPPFVILDVGGVRVGVVGAVRDDLASKVSPAHLAGLSVRPVPQAVNAAVAALRAHGVRTIIVLLHRGGTQAAYAGDTRSDAPPATGAIAGIVAGLDGDVDAVLSGDEHQFTNAFLPAADGRPVLVTQALDVGRAFAQVDLAIDAASGDVVEKHAAIRLVPVDRATVALVETARTRVTALTGRQVSVAAEPIGRVPVGADRGGESPLGDLVADAILAATGTDIAVVNAGSLRADLPAGPLTVKHLYDVLPFGNGVVAVRITGKQLRALLEEQWLDQPEPRRLHVAGFEYTWDERRPAGSRVVTLTRGGAEVPPDATLSLGMPSFVADGGDGFKTAAEAAKAGRTEGPLDRDALSAHMSALRPPLRARVDGRARRAP